MIPELGHFALILAFCLALVQAILPLIGVRQQNLAWQQSALYTAIGQTLFIGLSFTALAISFLTNDFSVQYVAQHSNTQLPAIYQFCAIWGGHEGSLLLWVLMLSGWMSAVVCCSRALPLDMIARVLSVMAMVAAGFLLFILLTSNPFTRFLPDLPDNGQDLNPLLQDPGLVIHPPFLYMGYVGFSVVFAFAIAALLRGDLSQSWAAWSRPWAVLAWIFLTIGIMLGSWWAYYELGWGGWWFWDPVENASLMPWLVGTALIHSLIVSNKRNSFKSWTVLLAISTFSLSLLGTFLVRSGVLTSVHAFANDPKRGAFILIFLSIVVIASLILYALNAAKLHEGTRFTLLSRETLLLSNNVILVVAASTVLLGTLYPLILDILNLEKISVGPPYFNKVFVPLVGLLLITMGMAPYADWQTITIKRLFNKLKIPLTIIVSVIAILWVMELPFRVILGVSLALWIMVTLMLHAWCRFRVQGMAGATLSYFGMVFAHVGVAITTLGVTLTSQYAIEKDIRMAVGDSVVIADYQFQFEGVSREKGSNYESAQGLFLVKKHNQIVAQLKPEKRFYTVAKTMQTETAIDPGLFRDLYVALGESLSDNSWSVRVYYKPFVRWLWLGALCMATGGILVVISKRKNTAC